MGPAIDKPGYLLQNLMQCCHTRLLPLSRVMGLNVNSIGDLQRHDEVDSRHPSDPIVAQIVGILDGDRERHLDHNRFLSRESVSVRDERTEGIYTCHIVPNREPQS